MKTTWKINIYTALLVNALNFQTYAASTEVEPAASTHIGSARSEAALRADLEAALEARNQPARVIELLAEGAPANGRMPFGATYLSLVCHRLAPSIEVPSTLSGTAEDDKRIVEALIAHGADVNARDALNSTALHSACHRVNADLILLLSNAGAKVDAVDQNGRRPLMLAVENRNRVAAKALIEAGAQCSAEAVALLGREDTHIAIRNAGWNRRGFMVILRKAMRKAKDAAAAVVSE